MLNHTPNTLIKSKQVQSGSWIGAIQCLQTLSHVWCSPSRWWRGTSEGRGGRWRWFWFPSGQHILSHIVHHFSGRLPQPEQNSEGTETGRHFCRRLRPGRLVSAGLINCEGWIKTANDQCPTNVVRCGKPGKSNDKPASWDGFLHLLANKASASCIMVGLEARSNRIHHPIPSPIL